MNKLIGRTCHRLCTFSTSIREIWEIKYYFNICGIRKEKERRGLRKRGGGWKFTHFTSPRSLPASPSRFSHSLLSSTGSFSRGCDRSFSPFEDSCVFFKTRRFFGMIVQVNIEGSSFYSSSLHLEHVLHKSLWSARPSRLHFVLVVWRLFYFRFSC